jgi:hypothetical protein
MYVLNKLIIISWFDNKLVSILSIALGPFDFAGATYANRWHMIEPLEIPTSPMIVHY